MRVKRKPPAFQFYANDFLGATRAMSAAEVGGYIRCLAHTWEDGPVPKDASKRARIIGEPDCISEAIWSTISHKFYETLSGFLNARLEEIRRESRKFSRDQKHKASVKSKDDKRLKRNRTDTQKVAKTEPDESQTLTKREPNDTTPISDLQTPITTLTKDQSACETAPTKALLSHFDTLHQKHIGVRAHIIGAKDASLVARLWKIYGEVDVRRLMTEFFETKDDWRSNAGFTVGVFHSQVGKLIARRANGRPRETTHDAIARMQAGGGRLTGER